MVDNFDGDAAVLLGALQWRIQQALVAETDAAATNKHILALMALADVFWRVAQLDQTGSNSGTMTVALRGYWRLLLSAPAWAAPSLFRQWTQVALAGAASSSSLLNLARVSLFPIALAALKEFLQQLQQKQAEENLAPSTTFTVLALLPNNTAAKLPLPLACVAASYPYFSSAQQLEVLETLLALTTDSVSAGLEFTAVVEVVAALLSAGGTQLVLPTRAVAAFERLLRLHPTPALLATATHLVQRFLTEGEGGRLNETEELFQGSLSLCAFFHLADPCVFEDSEQLMTVKNQQADILMAALLLGTYDLRASFAAAFEWDK